MKSKILIPFLISISIHITLIFAGNTFYKPSEVFFQPGESAIEMKLVASIANPESKKFLTIDEKVDEKIVDLEEAKKVTEEPDIATETEPITIVDDSVKEVESILKDGEENNTTLLQDVSILEPITNKNEFNEIKREKAKKMFKEENPSETEDLIEEQGEAESNSIHSSEIVADMLDKGIIGSTVKGIIKPKYPISCRKNGHEGTCVLKAIIDSQGNCIDIKIIQRAGCAKLDESAIKALTNAQFVPAEQFGVKIDGSKKIAFKFKIGGCMD